MRLPVLATLLATPGLVLPGLVAAGLVAAGPATLAAAPTFHPGASSVGDPLAPGLGNGGYDVSHYDLDLTYQPATGVLTGVATITATLTQDLSRFDLDFVLPARSVSVDGVAAAFRSQDGPDYSDNRDLVVTPATGLPTGHVMTVVVRYSAEPAAVQLDGYSNWTTTPTGATAWNEPDQAAQWWFPGNDHPSDKATYDVTVTTPAAYTAISNGVLVSRTVSGPRAVTHWRSTDQLSSHVAILTIGRYDVSRGTVLGGVPAVYAYEQGLGVLATRARADLARTPEVLSFLASRWGPYPLAAAGGQVVGETYPSSLETQTRPVYEAGLWQNATDNVWVVLHENSHQWFGDSVTFDRWRDVWLAEGFATYSEWLWSQAHGEGTAQQLFRATYAEHPASDSFWTEPTADPFYPLDSPVYQRGAMTLQALRNVIGTDDFFTLMRTWARTHRQGDATTAEFEALAEQVSGRDLTAFFAAWLSGTTRPAATPANGFPAGATLSGTPASLPAIQRADAALARPAQPKVAASMTAR